MAVDDDECFFVHAPMMTYFMILSLPAFSKCVTLCFKENFILKTSHAQPLFKIISKKCPPPALKKKIKSLS